jgi:hypothetical protein
LRAAANERRCETAPPGDDGSARAVGCSCRADDGSAAGAISTSEGGSQATVDSIQATAADESNEVRLTANTFDLRDG